MIEGKLVDKFSGLFIAGGVMFVAGCFLAGLSIVIGGLLTLGIILFFAGLGTLVFAVLRGLHHTMGPDSGKPEIVLNDVYIMAMLRVDSKGDMIFDPEAFDPSELKYLVQIQHADGTKIEYRTSPEVFGSMGEGMRGKAIVQGRWLAQFTFVPPGAGSTDHLQEQSYRA